jgi:hypothetical protein
VQTLGILDKLMTGPLWRILEDPAHVILDVSSHLLQLKLSLERFSVDASPLMEESFFTEGDATIHRDDQYAALLDPVSPGDDVSQPIISVRTPGGGLAARW